jgi:hypothetical protein
VAIEAAQCVRLEAVAAPVGSGGLAGGADDVGRDGRPEGMVRVRNAESRRDERPGELHNLMDDDVRLPRLDDLHEVVGPRPELDVDEQLREDERPDLRRRERVHLGERAPEQLARIHAEPSLKRREAIRSRLAGDRIAGCEGHVVTRRDESSRQRQHRAVVARQRPAAEEHAHARIIPSRARCAAGYRPLGVRYLPAR